jgi:hypothetical protein
MTAPVTEDVLIPLRGGFVVRTSIVLWLCEVSFRLRFDVLADGGLYVSPRMAITPADDQFLRAHRDDVIAALRFIEQPGCTCADLGPAAPCGWCDGPDRGEGRR